MTTDAALRHTPMHDAHEAAGAKMVPFAGWHMPVQYRGVIEEHRAVRTAAGLFDVSHMGEARVRGPQALDLLQWTTCNHVGKLKPGRAHYTALTTDRGTIVDDLLIYRLDEEDFLLVWNAANHAKDFEWLTAHARDYDAEVRDVADEWFQIALQGPQAVAILAPLAGETIADLKYYGFDRLKVDGVSCLVSRTGYTGEDGFELYGPADAGAALWAHLLEAGADRGLRAIGLAARDTLRLEAKMALYGNDIDETTTPIEADLGWIVKLKKGDFLGRDVLARQKLHGADRKLVGFELGGRRIARHGYPAWKDGREVGRVTSGTFAPWLEKSLGLVYLPIEHTAVGTTFEIDIRGRREPATVVETPFYRRDR
ncbi:MAG: glycine cleavage system aminomethyltransferase GcvT [Planctomycetota bacterium]|nr:glycine cleavage system aminomethyltransferase GcvT [Planctomycetota bacterium]